ncbi:hypothetical protein CRE_17691 [Caenorhabditis remanei]|uniref:Uncharacterized protein n=1 Tax=Caenorhabditis remanei TaxID=31234 RepID=E3NRF1_CAERE|nr:hypothetical protein CRE_17691 [Caenorhabditis remanei]
MEATSSDFRIPAQRRLWDVVRTILDQLRGLGQEVDNEMLKNMVLKKFNFSIQEAVYRDKMDLGDDTKWSMEQMSRDIESTIKRNEYLAMQMGREEKRGSERDESKAKQRSPKQNEPWKRQKIECILCGKPHFSSMCRTITDVHERLKIIQQKKACKGCYRIEPAHGKNECEGNFLCRECNDKHHYTLCVKKKQTSSQGQNAAKKTEDSRHASSSKKHMNVTTIRKESEGTNDIEKGDQRQYVMSTASETSYLATLKTEAYNQRSEKWDFITILIDCGASQTFIDEELMESFQLPVLKKKNLSLQTFGDEEPEEKTYAKTKIKIKLPSEIIEVKAIVAKTLAGSMQKAPLSDEDKTFIMMNGLRLNEDSLGTKVKPNMILGTDFLKRIWQGKMVELPSGLNLLKTALGYATIGRADTELIETSEENEKHSIFVAVQSRKNSYVSDVEKAFLQVHLHEDDRDATRVLWLKDYRQPPTPDNIVVYRFTRVLFGLNVSPFLLGATIEHHFESHPNRELAQEISTNLYVDNLILTTDGDLTTALQLYRESKDAFSDMKMNLREFLSNSEEFNESIDEKDRAKDLSTKVLGIEWNAETDEMRYAIKIEKSIVNSRRTVASTIAGIFDPLGKLVPLILPMKLFQRNLWNETYGWDTPLTEEDDKEWNQSIEAVNQFVKTLPRHVINKSGPNRLVTFTDASKEAIACCTYVITERGVELILAKSKVKPLKENWTIPKLETQAITLGVQMTKKTLKAMTEGKIEVESIHILSDSEIALAWLKSLPTRQEVGTLISNRLKTIQEGVMEMSQKCPIIFGYVDTKSNPADLGTRGIDSEAARSSIWWNGPSFLKEPIEQWPSSKGFFQLMTENIFMTVAKVTEIEKSPVFDLDCNIISCTDLILNMYKN